MAKYHLLETTRFAPLPLHALLLLAASSCSLITKDSLPECASEQNCNRADPLPQAGATGTSTGGSGGSISNPQAGSGGIQTVASAGANPDAGTGGSDVGSGGTTSTAGGGGIGGAPCVPTTETCNGRDDNCNAAADEGCPVGISWSSVQDRAPLGDSPYGSAFGEQCEKDELIIGLNLSLTQWLDNVAGICSKPSIGFTATGEPQLTLSAPRSLVQRPKVSEKHTDLVCPPREIMVGLRVSQQHSALGAANDRVVIPAVWLTCVEIYVTGNKLGAYGVELRNPHEIGPQQGSLANQSAWFHKDNAAANDAAVRVLGTAENWVERLGFGTSRFSVKLK
jgi:hypothetical protein